MQTIRRDKIQAGAKQQRIGVFKADDGRLLFVPTEKLWEIHYAASQCRFWDGKEWSIRELRAEVEQELGGKVPQWLFYRNYRKGTPRDYDWFFPWLLRGRQVSGSVHVAPPRAIAAARQAWDYAAHLRAAGSTLDVYHKWLWDGMLPSLPWLKWLFGWDAPRGVFVVDARLQKLRCERSIERILAAAQVSGRTYDLWGKDPAMVDVLPAAILAAGRSGHKGALAGNPAWEQLNARMQASLWRYAKAAVVSACCVRARIDPTVLTQARKEAAAYGAKDLLEHYLAIEGRRKDHKKCGLVSPNFFIPTPRMLAFRTAAAAAMARQKLSQFQHLPAFDDWFLDWVTPRSIKGERFSFPASAPAQLQERSDPPADASVNAPPAIKTKGRTRPAQEKHLKWKEWRENERLSYNDIARRHARLTGELTSADAVKKALKRLVVPTP
jgi:hypothetical protein